MKVPSCFSYINPWSTEFENDRLSSLSCGEKVFTIVSSILACIPCLCFSSLACFRFSRRILLEEPIPGAIPEATVLKQIVVKPVSSNNRYALQSKPADKREERQFWKTI
jgi:hypothetical protein